MKAPVLAFFLLCSCAVGTVLWIQSSDDFLPPAEELQNSSPSTLASHESTPNPKGELPSDQVGLSNPSSGNGTLSGSSPSTSGQLDSTKPVFPIGPSANLTPQKIKNINAQKAGNEKPSSRRNGNLTFDENSLQAKSLKNAKGLTQAKRDFLNKLNSGSAQDRLAATERDRRSDNWDPNTNSPNNSTDAPNNSSDGNGDDEGDDNEQNEKGEDDEDDKKEDDEEEEEVPPASWVILLLDAADEPVISAPLALDPQAPAESIVYTDFEGKARFDNIQPEQAWSLYHLDPVEGAQLLDTHQFESEEEYYNTYSLDSGGNEKGSLTLRIQSSEGKEIREGWVANTLFLSENEIPSLLAGGAFIQAVVPGQSITFEGITPHEDISLNFISGGFESIFLQSLTLKSGEEKNLGTLRLQNDSLLSSYLSGIILDEEFNPVSELNLELISGLQTPKETQVDENGFFSFEGLNRFQRYTLIGRDGQGHSEILIDDLLIDELEVYRELQWVGLRSVTFSIRSKGEGVDGAHLTLSPLQSDIESSTPPRILDKISNSNGLIEVEGLYPLQNYELNLSHPFYQTINLPQWSLGDQNDVELDLDALRGVKVQLTGPNVQLGLTVRAWIGVERDGFIVPDYQPGNEYDQVITEDELLFATPPEERFWVYIGGLSEPWGNGLHGPYTPGKDEFIQIDLKEVEPLYVDISETQMPDGTVHTWNLLVYALAGGTEAFTQIKGQQLVRGIYTSRAMFLHPGDYRLRVQSDWHEKAIEDIQWDGNQRVESFRLTPRPAPTSTEGWVRSFLISDTFPLILSNHNPHHEEMSYGFNVDFLSNLGGERRYQARHLGEHLSFDRTRSIVWRQHDLASDQWFVDLKDYSLFPSDAGDYVTSYLQFQVQSPSSREAILALNSDDGFKAWVNGDLVGQINIGRPIYQSSRVRRGDQALLPIRLNAGLNQLNFKVTNSFGFFQFAARVLNPLSDEPFTDITYLPEPLAKSKAE